MTQATLKLENAEYILTMDPRRRIIRDGAIVITGQQITHVGKTAELKHIPAERVIDASNTVVTPGFVNGHMHISYAHAVRGIFPDHLHPQEYLRTVFQLQNAMTEEEEYYTSLLGITELIKYGTTCFLDPGTTKFIDACMQVYEDTGCRIITGAQVVDLPNPLDLPVVSTREAIDITKRTIKQYDGRLNGRMRAWAMPFSADTATPELMQAAKRLADEYGTGLTIHQPNRPDVVRRYREQYGMLPVEYLEKQGWLGENVLLAHLVGLDSPEVEAMARTGAKGVFCPTAALKTGAGLTHRGHILPQMLEKGVGVGLGTDAPNNSNLIETLRSMYLASVVYKDANRTTKVMPAETVVELATVEGARALLLEKEIGSLEPGKRADIVLFDTMRPEWRALFNPVNNLVYNADGRSVKTVIIDGRVVVDDYQVTFVDEVKLIEKVQELGEALLARTGVSYPPVWPVE